MKQTFSILLIFVTSLSFSQEYYDTDMTRDKPKLKNYNLETTRLIDSTGGKPYTSLIQIFDKKGRHKVDYEFDRNGDTIAQITTTYPNKLTEIEIHSYKTVKSDTAIFKYNKKNKQTVEIWKWGENKTIDTTKFFYDKKHRLIADFDVYEFGTNQDSIFYENNRIVKSISYDSGKTDSVSYQYKKDKIIGIKKYNIEKELVSNYKIEIGRYDKPKRIENKYRSYNSKIFDMKTITIFEYHNKRQIKSKIVMYFKNGEIEKSTEFHFSKFGYLEESKAKDSEGKTTSAHKITLHNNGYN
ncbi:hypothetical protein [Winogradskyella sp. UBA3174]|uniref:hypothetical protein n=1 Tax=Winogradskyella sp. UBA3174 TaxID=1947785 RepID=UPI0025EF5441|nr:hypothetical protein [Winogradskyella sp. UBA3174]|tara:strand:- start:1884 stop:2777 length:894 start_codon:yes stop_codon:yes gene_type:complete